MSNLTAAPAKRTFTFNGRNFDDPDPSMLPAKVMEFYSSLCAPLTNSEVKGPSIGPDGVEHYKFEVKIGNDN